MTDEPNPWGIIATRTLHLTIFGLDPLCGDKRVQRIVDGLRDLYRSGVRDAPSIYGPADGRPVCRTCVRTAQRMADRIAAELAEVAAYEAAREAQP